MLGQDLEQTSTGNVQRWEQTSRVKTKLALALFVSSALHFENVRKIDLRYNAYSPRIFRLRKRFKDVSHVLERYLPYLFDAITTALAFADTKDRADIFKVCVLLSSNTASLEAIPRRLSRGHLENHC